MRSFKTELKLNNKQITLCEKHAGVARYAYNWGLSICETAYEIDEQRPSAIDLHKYFVRDEKSVKPWLYEISKSTPQLALMTLDRAFKNFFRRQNVRPPTYKKKGIHDSFGLEGTIKVNEKSIQVPKLGKLRTFEKLPTNANPKICTINKTAGRWFISFISDKETTTYISNGSPTGVDLGVKTLATLSNGITFKNPKAFNKYKNKLAIAQRQAANRKLGSKNRKKSNQKVAKIHYKIANIRKDSIHKLTTYLAKNHSKIFIEDLSIKSMLKTKGLAGAIADGAFYEIRRQLEYKAQKVNVIDRFYPSSQLCSTCGTKQKLKLSQRTYKCNNCNLIIDRDLNAAINILNYTGAACPEVPTVKSRN